jgi:hypothetical protein
MSKYARLQATGPSGEACIVIRIGSEIDASNLGGRSALAGLASYQLETGERLNQTDDPKVFQTLDQLKEYRIG